MEVGIPKETVGKSRVRIVAGSNVTVAITIGQVSKRGHGFKRSPGSSRDVPAKRPPVSEALEARIAMTELVEMEPNAIGVVPTASAKYVLVVLKRAHAVGEGVSTNNVVAVPRTRADRRVGSVPPLAGRRSRTAAG